MLLKCLCSHSFLSCITVYRVKWVSWIRIMSNWSSLHLLNMSSLLNVRAGALSHVEAKTKMTGEKQGTTDFS